MSRKYKGREYPKWVITVPPKQIEELGWVQGESLASDVANEGLMVKKESPQKVEKRREVARRAWETRRRTKRGP